MVFPPGQWRDASYPGNKYNEYMHSLQAMAGCQLPEC